MRLRRVRIDLGEVADFSVRRNSDELKGDDPDSFAGRHRKNHGTVSARVHRLGRPGPAEELP